MNNRLSRILTRWLKTHTTHSLALCAARVAMDEGDEEALLLNGERLPITIYNDVDDTCLTPKFNPDRVPALAIIPQVSVNAPVQVRRGQLEYFGVEVAMSYMERDTPEVFARQRGGYIMNALQDSMIEFNKPDVSKAIMPGSDMSWRALGDIEVLEVKALEEMRITMGVAGCTMFGSLIGAFNVRRFLP